MNFQVIQVGGQPETITGNKQCDKRLQECNTLVIYLYKQGDWFHLVLSRASCKHTFGTHNHLRAAELAFCLNPLKCSGIKWLLTFIKVVIFNF